jgi:hypothetical protein
MNIKWNWGTKLVIAMAAFMLMILGFVAFMVRQEVSLVEKDYYPKGQAYQEMIKKTQNTIPYASEIVVSYDENFAYVTFPSFFRPGAVKGEVHFYHRVSDVNDFLADLILDENGVFSYPVKRLRGRYIIKLDWEQDGIEYYTEKNLSIE